MWIRALEVFRVEGADPTSWGDEFARYPLTDPVGGNPQSMGFVLAPEGTRLVDELNGRYAFVTGLAMRNLPSEAVDRETKKRLEKLHPEPDAEINKDERDSLWNQVRDELMPNAPILEVRTAAVYCSHTRLLYVFGASKKGVEALQMTVRTALGSFMILPVRPRDSASMLMTEWLRDKAPDCLGVGESMTLDAGDGTVAFKKHDLYSDTVQQHIESGNVVKKMELVWRDELSFELNDKGELSKIGPIGCKMNPKLAFVHWPEIMTQLPQFTAEVMAVLGEPSLLEELQAALVAGGQEPSAVPETQDPPSTLDLAPPVDALAPDPEAGGFLPVVLPAEDAPVELVHRMLEAIAGRWPLDGLVVMSRPVDAYRTLYAWATERGLPVTLMEQPDPAAGCELPAGANAVVWAGEDAIIQAVTAAARSGGLPVFRMQPTQS